MFFIILLQALYGCSLPINKILLRYASPCFASGSRMVLAGIILVCFWCIKHKDRALPITCSWLHTQIIVATYLKYALRTWSLAHMSCSRMALLLHITPFIAACTSFFALESLSYKQWIAVCIGTVGTLLPIFEGIASYQMKFVAADIALIFAIIAHCYAQVATKQALKTDAIPLTNGIRMLGGGTLMLATSWCIEQPFPAVQNVQLFSFWLFVLLLLSNMICHTLYLYLLKYHSVTLMCLAEKLINFFSILYAWYFLGEILPSWYIYAAALLALGIMLFYTDEYKLANTKRITLAKHIKKA